MTVRKAVARKVTSRMPIIPSPETELSIYLKYRGWLRRPPTWPPEAQIILSMFQAAEVYAALIGVQSEPVRECIRIARDLMVVAAPEVVERVCMALGIPVPPQSDTWPTKPPVDTTRVPTVDLIDGKPYCHAGRQDGECYWPACPQVRDGEPMKTGRDCPYWDREAEKAEEM